MTSADATLPPEAPRLSLTEGGPLFLLEKRLRLDVPVLRTITVTVALTWGISVALGLVHTLLLSRTGEPDPVLLRIGGHTRLLVGIPLLILAERVLEERGAMASTRIVSHGILDVSNLTAWRDVVRRVVRWRDSRLPELAIAAVVVIVTIAGIAGILPGGFLRWFAPTLHPSVRAGVSGSPAMWWFIAVGQPVFMFLLFRWLWHWCLWALALARLARLRPRLQASHPDHAGGIAFLQESLDALSLVVLCVSTSLAATWADEIVATRAAAATFAPFFVAQVLASLVVGIAPFLPLTPSLFRAKRRGTVAYSRLARVYIEEFDEKWIVAPSAEVLGTPDLQSLADLGNSFRVAEEMRLWLVSPRRALSLVFFAVSPVLPLVLYGMPATELARRIIELVM